MCSPWMDYLSSEAWKEPPLASLEEHAARGLGKSLRGDEARPARGGRPAEGGRQRASICMRLSLCSAHAGMGLPARLVRHHVTADDQARRYAEYNVAADDQARYAAHWMLSTGPRSMRSMRFGLRVLHRIQRGVSHQAPGGGSDMTSPSPGSQGLFDRFRADPETV
jgi:hypothetical protein